MEPTLSERKKESYKIFNEISGTYDFLNHFLSAGIDIYWRKQLMRQIPKGRTNLQALDLATGTGDVALGLAASPSIAKITGIDMSQGMIEQGKIKVKKRGLESKINLDIGDGVEVPYPDNSFDLVTLSFGIRNFSDPLKSLKNIYRVLRPNGKVVIIEFSLPKSALIRKPYLFYFRKVLPKVGNLLSGHADAYSYLNKTVEDFPYGESFLQLAKQAGFSSLKQIPLSFGIAALYVGEKH